MDSYRYHKRMPKGTIRCSFCGMYGHNKANCPTVSEIINHVTSEGRTPETDLEVKAFDIHLKKQKISPKKPRRCGFCSSDKHTRRTCPHISYYSSRLHASNECWRATFIQKAEKIGFGQGALIEMSQDEWLPTGGFSKQKNMYLIKELRLDSFSVFCSLSGGFGGNNLASSQVTLLHRIGKPSAFSRSFLAPTANSLKEVSKIFNTDDKKLFANHRGWSAELGHKIITPALLKVPEGWVVEKLQCVDWALKRFSLKRLRQMKIDELLNDW